MGSPILFIVVAAIAIASAVGMLLSKNAVHSAMYLVLNFTAVAVLYIVLHAPFIAMVQVTVYAGAIMVLFLFVIMLLGAEQLEGATGGGGGWQRPFAVILGIALAISFFAALGSSRSGTAATISNDFANPESIGLAVFQDFVFPFEVTSILLLVSMISLVVWRTQKKKS